MWVVLVLYVLVMTLILLLGKDVGNNCGNEFGNMFGNMFGYIFFVKNMFLKYCLQTKTYGNELGNTCNYCVGKNFCHNFVDNFVRIVDNSFEMIWIICCVMIVVNELCDVCFCNDFGLVSL